MTERMLPSGDGPTACPFVAFDDDRDHRAAAADHRHRCYAEVRPAVRSHAHQDAFCVSAAFPACPTFLDWARREAAVARPGRPDRHADESEPGSPAGPIGRPSTSPDRPVDPPTEGGPAVPPTTALPRRGRRDWAAPPPWSVQPAPGPAPDPPPPPRRG